MAGRGRQWGRSHPVAARLLSGLLFAAVFFLLSLTYSSPARAIAMAIIAAALFTALMYLIVDRRSRGLD